MMEPSLFEITVPPRRDDDGDSVSSFLSDDCDDDDDLDNIFGAPGTYDSPRRAMGGAGGKYQPKEDLNSTMHSGCSGYFRQSSSPAGDACGSVTSDSTPRLPQRRRGRNSFSSDDDCCSDDDNDGNIREFIGCNGHYTHGAASSSSMAAVAGRMNTLVHHMHRQTSIRSMKSGCSSSIGRKINNTAIVCKYDQNHECMCKTSSPASGGVTTAIRRMSALVREKSMRSLKSNGTTSSRTAAGDRSTTSITSEGSRRKPREPPSRRALAGASLGMTTSAISAVSSDDDPLLTLDNDPIPPTRRPRLRRTGSGCHGGGAGDRRALEAV